MGHLTKLLTSSLEICMKSQLSSMKHVGLSDLQLDSGTCMLLMYFPLVYCRFNKVRLKIVGRVPYKVCSLKVPFQFLKVL